MSIIAGDEDDASSGVAGVGAGVGAAVGGGGGGGAGVGAGGCGGGGAGSPVSGVSRSSRCSVFFMSASRCRCILRFCVLVC